MSDELNLNTTPELTFEPSAAQAVEVKQVAGKAVIRGELTLHILYQSAPGEFGQLDYTLPTNTICELDGLTEESVCDVWQQVTSVTAEPAATEDRKSVV